MIAYTEGLPCDICGFKKATQLHHIIKHVDGGASTPNNLVRLCPNHHWLADFGTMEDRFRLLSIIKKLTGKVGETIPEKELLYLERKTMVLSLQCFNNEIPGNQTKEEWKNSYNYYNARRILTGRGTNKQTSTLANQKAEILLLQIELKKELVKIEERIKSSI